MLEFFRIIVRMVVKVLYKVEIKGIENLPKEGPILLCANHVGELDMVFIGYKLKRLVHWMAKEEPFKNPVFGGFIKWLGAFPVKRGKGGVGAIRTALKLLDEGNIVGIFAEGHRARTRQGKKSKIHPGAAMIAIKKGVPILPVGVDGSSKPFSKVRVVFGKPYLLEVDKDKKHTNDELTEISEGIISKVYGLLEDR